ncbi:hemagglutinin repeat-containing protein [Caballeronia arvi]|nr:hemagglutinin repeat-containing protein [Caballeronia arvi]
MNKNFYKLVFSRVRNMLIAVADFAIAQGGGAARGARRAHGALSISNFSTAVSVLAWIAMLLLRTASTFAVAQIVAAPGSGAKVIQTQNGLPQVDIARPSGAGVSVNTYSQFDVQRQGAILNNSPTITQTQQAGYINGNANLTPGQEARVIVNQVMSNSPSQLRGYLEVAGPRSEVIIANPNGLVVDGGGFINTSRAILTTGTPNFGPNGSLAGFSVNGGNITVQGAGLNATNVDQVDLLARAIQVNAAVYAKSLNVIAGVNSIDHDSLDAKPVAGNGPAPSAAIDVSQLGGMYANRIFLSSNEYGVGVSTRGVLAAQAGDLTLQSNGQLVLAGTTNASGSISASARDGITNSGTTYAQRDVIATSSGALTNTGVLAAQNNTTVNAGSVASAGTLGAGVNSDGTIANTGELNVLSSGAVSATGRNEGGGNTTIQGTSVNLAGSNTSANGTLSLDATSGDMNLSGASTTAGGALAANATGTLTNDQGKASSGGAMHINAGNVSNANGQLVSQSTLDVNTRGTLNNRGGTMQAAGRESIQASSLDNTSGRVVSLNADGLNVTTTGALVNGAGGTIGTNGALGVAASTLSNQGQLTAAGDATVRAQRIDNHAGSITAGGALNATSSGALDNTSGTLSGATTTVSAASIDNTNGDINGDTLAVSTPGALVNRGGKLTQYGANDQTIIAGGALDNTGGAIASNANNLNVRAQSITNDSGSMQHAGTGALVVDSKGVLSNAAGQIVTNGALALQAALALSNARGTIQAARRADISSASLDNTGGRIVSLNADGLSVTTTGAVLNGAGGTIGTNGALDLNAATLANQGGLNAAGNATVNAQRIDNHAGSITAGGALTATTPGALDNTGGTLSGAVTTVSGASIDNTNGDIEGDALAVSTPGDLVNRGGKITQYGASDQTIHAGGVLDSTGGAITSNANSLKLEAQSVTNDSGKIQHAGSGTLALNATAAISNAAGNVQTNGALVVDGASLDNTSGTLLAMQAAQVNAASGIANRGGSVYGGDGLSVATQGDIDNTGGSAQTAGDLSISAGGTLTNAQGTVSANGTHGTTNVTAARIDNTGGKLTNAGDGATTVAASDVTNTGGTLGGNGDVTVNAQTLENDAGANLVAGGAANLNIAQSVNNAGGTLFGGTALNVGQASATVINDGGAILGGLDVSSNVASLSNANGSIRANRDVSVSGVVSGDGAMIAGRNLGLAVIGDYTNDAANNLHADGDMSLSATGTLTNTGTLGAGGALTVGAQDVVNAASGDINSSNTTVNAANVLSNAGRIEGDTVSTHSATLANTGTIIGNDVELNANDIQNTGAAAAIAGANSVHLYAANSVTNADGALIYSLGDLQIAKDGTRDASGMLANQTNTLINSAATIEAGGDIDIAARSVQNLRTGVVTEAGTPQDAGSTTLTLWTAGLSGDELATYHSSAFPQWNWSNGAISDQTVHGLAQPITVTVPKDQVTNVDASAQTFSLTVPVEDTTQRRVIDPKTGLPTLQQTSRVVTNNPTQWYNSLTDNGDGTVSITFWPDFDPNTQMRPDADQVRWDIDNHDYVEMSRTTQTTTTTDRVVSAGNAATIQAQGAIRMNADGGSIDNDMSTMAAGGDLVRRATGGSISDTGVVLQQKIDQTTSSIYYWHQKSGGSSDTTEPRLDGKFDGITSTTTTVDALPAIASSNQNVQTNAASISINSIDRQGQTVIGSGVTGGSADGTQTGMIAGQGGTASGVDGHQAQAVSGQSSAPQTVGGATGGIPNLKLPVNGLYTYNSAPGATYLIATNPRLTQYAQFISSDYMLKALDLDPSKTIKRLGDGVYEQQLIRNQITQLTGRTFLNGYTDAMDEYTALMNNGVAFAKRFDLTPGVALTPAQMQQLTTDMVWLVEQDVTLPDGSHQTVLVPTVYLAQANAVDLTHSGALVAGNNVNLNASGNVTNSGHVTSNLATTIIGNNIVNSGVIGSGGMTTVTAVQDVRNTSGRIGGSDVLVQAGRDVINETRTYGVSTSFTDRSFSGVTTGTGVDAIGTISATDRARIIAGRDVNFAGALAQSEGDLGIAAGRDLNVGTTTLTSTKDSSGHGGQDFRHDTVTQELGSAIVAGGKAMTLSGRDTTLTGSTLSAGGDAGMIAGGDLTVTASKNTRTYSEQSLSNSQSQHANSSYDEQVNGSSVSAGGNVTLAAGQHGSGNLVVLGSEVSADKGEVALISTGDVTIGSVSETHDAQGWSHSESSGALSKTTTNDTSSSHQVIAQGSTVSGDTVTGSAGRDMTISGSTVAATHDVSLEAGNNLRIDATQDTSESSHFHEERKTGLGSSGGVGISYGTVDTKDTINDADRTARGSLIGSTSGNVTMQAGNTLHVTGSDIVAAGNVTGTGADVVIDASQTDRHHDETHETHSSGVTLAIKSSVIDAIQTASQQARAAESGSGNARVDTLHTLAAAGSLINGASPMMQGQGPDAKIELSVGSSSSKSTFTEDSTQRNGSNITAGGTAAFVATGNGTPGSGSVTIAGSNVNASDVILAAKNQVNLVSSADTDSTRSTNESSSGSIGVSYGTQGFGISASGSRAHGNANSDSAAQNNTHIKGSESVSIVSGGDTNIKGATVDGGKVSALIGGDLNIESIQDTSHSVAHQESQSAGVSISQGGGSASFSSQNGNASGDYAGVEEQSGIRAGKGGFDINVKGNTDLKGAYIASDADASKNSLTTGTLTFSDIANASSYDASSSGFSAGGSMGASDSAKANGVTSLSNGGGISPMLPQNESGNETASTRSGISAGTITITDGANQKQDIASLNRDTTDLNGTVSKLPDLNNLLNQQASTQQAAAIVAQTVATQIGNYADSKFKETSDPRWDTGGSFRIAMHIAGGAAVAGLGGGNVAGGAAGAGVSAAAAGYVNDVSNAITGASPTGNADADRALGNILGNVLATGAGALAGGSSGAATGSAANLYNDQVHCTNVGGCKGSQGTLVDRAINGVVDWVKDTYNDPVGDVKRWVSQATGQMNADAQAKASERPSDLIAQGTANGIQTVIGAKGGEPPMANPGTVLADSTAGAVPKKPNVPSNAILNNGNDDQSFGGKSINDLSDAAKMPDSSDRSGELSAAGRGLQKHGSREDSAFPPAKGNPAAINEQGQKIVNEILNDPGRTVEQSNRGRYGDVIDVRASDGRGVRYGADGKFIGFLEPNK